MKKRAELNVGDWIVRNNAWICEITVLERERSIFYMRQIYPKQVKYESSYSLLFWEKFGFGDMANCRLITDQKEKLAELLKWQN